MNRENTLSSWNCIWYISRIGLKELALPHKIGSLTCNGDAMNSSFIEEILDQKYSTSTVHGNMPEIKQVTANLLCHSLRIAEKTMLVLVFKKQL